VPGGFSIIRGEAARNGLPAAVLCNYGQPPASRVVTNTELVGSGFVGVVCDTISRHCPVAIAGLWYVLDRSGALRPPATQASNPAPNQPR
jgi:hypothetical protein